MLRREFVERKLQLIVEDLGRLSAFRELSYEHFTADAMLMASVERMLERIVLRAIDVNEHLIAALATGAEQRTTRLAYKDTFLKLCDYGVIAPDFASSIALSASLRNILVHEYNDIDHKIVHAAIALALEQYTRYAADVQRFLDRPEAGIA